MHCAIEPMKKHTKQPLRSLLSVAAVFLFESLAFAQAASEELPPAPSGLELLMNMVPMFVIVFFIFYFMIIRPQQQRLTAQADLIRGLKKGDSVVTSGGIFGKVQTVEKDHVVLEIASNVKVKIETVHVVKKQPTQAVEKAA